MRIGNRPSRPEQVSVRAEEVRMPRTEPPRAWIAARDTDFAAFSVLHGIITGECGQRTTDKFAAEAYNFRVICRRGP
jgi:hypothetical protein